MSKEEIQAWAKITGIRASYIRQELRRENNLNRARKDPSNWVILRFPNGEVNAFPRVMFPEAA